MTGHKRKRYPENWEAIAQACKELAGWTCQHCGIEQYALVESRAGRPYIIYLHAAHVYHDQSNQQPELLCLCISCHARYDYRHKQQEKLVELERLKHRKLLASRVDLRFYGG